jgi:hypothetical protein
MSLSCLPLSESFALAWEYDPAFDRDAKDEDGNSTFEHDYRTACETLNWAKLCRPGQVPTLFHFRPLSGMPWRRLLDHEGGLQEKVALTFRLALVSMENAEGLPEVKRATDLEYPGLGKMASSKLMDALDEMPIRASAPTGHLVSSLGDLVFRRSSNLSPRS